MTHIEVKMSANVEPTSASDSSKEEFMFARSTWMLALEGIYPGDIVQRYRKWFILNCYYKTMTIANMLLESSTNIQTLLNVIVCSLTISKDIKRLKKHVYNYDKLYCFCANVAKIKRYTTFTILAMVVIILVKVLVVVLQSSHSTWLSESPWIEIGRFVSVFNFIISSAQTCGFCNMILAMLYILRCEFTQIDEKLKKTLVNPRVEIIDTLTFQHEALAKIVSEASTSVQFFNFNILFLTLIWNGVYFYITVSQSVPISENMFIWTTISWAMACIAGVLLMQACLASKAQAPLQYLWMFNKNRFSDRGLLKLNLWVSRLTVDPIAYNIYGFININYQTLTAVLGTVVTYLFVVLQFRSPIGTQCQSAPMNVSLNIQ